MKSLLLVLFVAAPSLMILGDFSGDSTAFAMGRGSNPCEPAMDNYCGGLLTQGHDKLAACLQEHWDQLPQSCKDLMTPKGTSSK
jgi:hypothetical protein